MITKDGFRGLHLAAMQIKKTRVAENEVQRKAREDWKIHLALDKIIYASATPTPTPTPSTNVDKVEKEDSHSINQLWIWARAGTRVDILRLLEEGVSHPFLLIPCSCRSPLADDALSCQHREIQVIRCKKCPLLLIRKINNAKNRTTLRTANEGHELVHHTFSSFASLPPIARRQIHAAGWQFGDAKADVTLHARYVDAQVKLGGSIHAEWQC